MEWCVAPQAYSILVPVLLDALLPSAILNPTETFVLWCPSFLCSLKFLGSAELFKPAWGHEDKAQLWLWDWSASWPVAASQGHWVKPIWTFAINIKETTTLNGFGIWNQKPNLNVRAGPYLQTKLNWMFRPQLWQRNESCKSKSAFCISAPLVMLIILCPFTISNILETLKWFIKWVILPSQTHKS